LKSTILSKYVDRLGRGGTQKFIALRDIRAFSFPLHLQNHFADFIRTAEKIKHDMQQGLDKLELLYKSMMLKYFKGDYFEKA